jgi:hypothetical protein
MQGHHWIILAAVIVAAYFIWRHLNGKSGLWG